MPQSRIAIKDAHYQDNKARFAKSTIEEKDSFYVHFRDSQLLHRRRQKLLKLDLILDNCVETAQGCRRFCRELTTVSKSASSTLEPFLSEIELYISKVGGHKRTINLLLKQSAGTSKLVRFH